MRILALALAVLLCCMALPASTCPPASQGGPNPSYNAGYFIGPAPSATIDGVSITGTQATVVFAGKWFTSSPWNDGDMILLGSQVLSIYDADQPNGIFTTPVVSQYLSPTTHVLSVTVNLPYAISNSNGTVADSGYAYTLGNGNGTQGVNIEIDGQTTGNVACMSAGEPTPHKFYGSYQKSGGTLVSGSIQEPLTYVTGEIQLTGLQAIALGQTESIELQEEIDCPDMGEPFFDVVLIPQFHFAYERTAQTGNTGQCETHEVAWLPGIDIAVTNCVYTEEPWCSNIPYPALPDLNVTRTWYTTQEGAKSLPIPFGNDWLGFVGRYPGGLWFDIYDFGDELFGAQTFATCTYTP